MNQYRPSVECKSFVFYFTLAINTQTTNSPIRRQVKFNAVVHQSSITRGSY